MGINNDFSDSQNHKVIQKTTDAKVSAEDKM